MTATRPTSVPGSPPVAELLYADFESEFATTRRFLERYPAGKDDWRPHPSSRALRALANHVADLPARGTMIQAPKRLLLRTMQMSHLVHHRAQLGVYYRLLGVPVPGAYGPSADEGLVP